MKSIGMQNIHRGATFLNKLSNFQLLSQVKSIFINSWKSWKREGSTCIKRRLARQKLHFGGEYLRRDASCQARMVNIICSIEHITKLKKSGGQLVQDSKDKAKEMATGGKDALHLPSTRDHHGWKQDILRGRIKPPPSERQQNLH